MSVHNRPDLTAEEKQQMLDLLATGRYRRSTVSRLFGQTEQAFYMREKRDPDFALAVDVAIAQGEKAITDQMMEKADKGESGWNAYAWLSERVHRVIHPVDEARIEEIKARTKAISELSSPEAIESMRGIVASIYQHRPKPPDDQPPQTDEATDAATR